MYDGSAERDLCRARKISIKALMCAFSCNLIGDILPCQVRGPGIPSSVKYSPSQGGYLDRPIIGYIIMFGPAKLKIAFSFQFP